MRTNIDIDPKLLKQVMKSNPNLKTKRDAVNFALWNTVQRGREKSWAELVAMKPLAPDYDYKQARKSV